MKSSTLNQSIKRWSKMVMIFIFFGLVSGCARWGIKDRVSPPPKAEETKGIRKVGIDSPSEYEYRIGPNDTIQVRFVYYSDLLEPQIGVPSDGIIQMPLIGGVQVIGTTEEQLNSLLKERYANHLKFPELVARVTGRQHDGVYLDGVISMGGSIAYYNQLTLLAALKKGGMGEAGAMHSVIILRGLNTPEFKAFRIDATKILRGQEHDIYLEPNDIVYVPKKFITDVDYFVSAYIDRVLGTHVAPAIVFPQAFPFKGNQSGTFQYNINVQSTPAP